MPEPHEVLNALPADEARRALARCCGARRWIAAMAARLPFASAAALYAAAEEEWQALGESDQREAFLHHPRIGAALGPAGDDVAAAPPAARAAEEIPSTTAWARAEQAGAAAAGPLVRERLRAGNVAYAERFGFSFITCATGKSAEQMLSELEARLANTPGAEQGIAAREQARITRLRLEKLGT